MSPKDWLKVDRKMIPSKLCYFFQNAKSSLQVYMILFLTQLGLNTQEASIVSGIQFLGFVLGGPCLGFLADKFKCHYKIAQISLMISTLAFIVGPVVSISLSDVNTNKCKPSLSNSQFNTTVSNSTEKIFNKKNTLTESRKITLISLSTISFTIASMFGDPILGFVDAACVHKSSTVGKDQFYSHQRLFEPLGWQFGILFASLFVKYFPKADVTCYTGVFVSCALYNILLMISFYALMRSVSNDDAFQQRVSSNFQELWNTLKTLITTPKHLLFFANVGIVGIFFGIHASLIYPHLEDLSKSLSYLNGYTAICSTTSILVYVIGPAIYKWFEHHWIVFLAILIVFATKMFIFAMTQNLDVLLASGVLFSFQAVFMIAVVFYVKQEMPKELHSTIFNIVNVLLVSFGYVVANIIGGIIYNTYGPKELFFCVFALISVWLVVVLFHVIISKCSENNQVLNNQRENVSESQDVVIANRRI